MKKSNKPTWCAHYEEEFKTADARDAFCNACAREALAANADLFMAAIVDDDAGEFLENWHALEADQEPQQEPAPIQHAPIVWPQACDQLRFF